MPKLKKFFTHPLKQSFSLLAFIGGGIAIISLVLVVNHFVLSWTEPTANPPGGFTPPGSGSVPSGSYVAFPDPSPRQGWTYTGFHEIKVIGDTWDVKEHRGPLATYLAATAVNNKIYVMGGQSLSGQILATTEEYDPATDTWTTKADMPTAALGFVAVTVNGKIYAIKFNSNEEYDPIANIWTVKTPSPLQQDHVGAAAINDKIYVFYSSATEEYDPITDTWTAKTPMPSGRFSLVAAAVNGKIYAIGGANHINGTVVLSSVTEEYDPATDTWTTKADMPTPRSNFAAAAVNGKIYAIGGGNASGAFFAATEEYDPATDTWTARAPMPTARDALAAAAVNGKIYTFGGNGGGVSPVAVVEEYTPPSNTATLYWFQKD